MKWKKYLDDEVTEALSIGESMRASVKIRKMKHND